jgi:hypothetical protein
MTKVSIFIFLATAIAGAVIYQLFFGYESYAECEIRELQKLSYEPQNMDRNSIQLYCELKFPYEKEIYGPTISNWNGQLITVHNDENMYQITKVKIFVKKGNCENSQSDLKAIIYHVGDGVTGATFDWSEEYKCYIPEKTQFWGKIRKEAF